MTHNILKINYVSSKYLRINVFKSCMCKIIIFERKEIVDQCVDQRETNDENYKVSKLKCILTGKISS